jgi:hypothetical protein
VENVGDDEKSIVDEAFHLDHDVESVGDDAFFNATQPEKHRA